MASISMSRLISFSLRCHYPAVTNAASAINAEASKAISPSWSSSPEEIRLSAHHACTASNVVSTQHLQQQQNIARVYHSLDQHKGCERQCSQSVLAARTLCDLSLVDVSAAFVLMSVEDKAVRLPSFERRAPMTPPPSAPVTPQQLPDMPGSVSTIVEPYQDLLPRLLPSAHDVAALECVNMVRLHRKRMKKHKRKKQYKRNRVSHEHRILMDIIRREKAFMLEQTTLLDEAEQFSAEQYVADKIKTYQRPVPRFWKGKRLPQSVVIGLMRKSGLPVPGIDDW